MQAPVQRITRGDNQGMKLHQVLNMTSVVANWGNKYSVDKTKVDRVPMLEMGTQAHPYVQYSPSILVASFPGSSQLRDNLGMRLHQELNMTSVVASWGAL